MAAGMIVSMQPRDPLNRMPAHLRALLAGVLLLLACYASIFVVTTGATWGSALLDALINVGSLALWGALAGWLNHKFLLDRSAALQALLHPLTAFGFALAWYFSVTVLLGWRAGDFSGMFTVQPFSSVAFVWQSFQGLTLYALIVALAVIERLSARPAAIHETLPNRLLVRGQDGLVSIPVAEIVCIERAGDYAQLVTASGRHLTRKSLAELERHLPTERFLRIHRACLINLDALESAEPIGGGRMRAVLSGDIRANTSRTGARLLRERAG